MGTEGIIVKHGTHFYHLKLDTAKDTLIATYYTTEKKGRKTIKKVHHKYFMHTTRYSDLLHFYETINDDDQILVQSSSERILTHLLYTKMKLTKAGQKIFHSIPSAEAI